VSPDPLPLADAQARLGRPGRPRKPKPTLGEQIEELVAPAARLLGVRATAAYMGIGVRLVYELRAGGLLQPVSLPRGGGRQITKLLFDRRDLDAFIDANKAG
jgi:hypothetical protein